MMADLIAFTKDMDRCWIERRFDDLADFLARDVILVTPDGKHRIKGLDASIDSYREFMSRCEVSRFDVHSHVVTQLHSTAVVEYGWDMAWNDQGTEYEALGREVLVLAQSDGRWQVIWRTQLSA